jgi:ATP-dependent DNA helicase PIF1
MSFIRGRGQIVLPFATTGIAATLLKGGRTAHSGFKLPVPLLDTSVSSMRVDSKEAEVVRQASLLIIDEITMLNKHGLRCIDKLLQEIMRSEKPFGGKVIVVGGDFRQTLPVVARGTRIDIIECCIKSSSLWSHFMTLELSTNMRSEGQHEHNDWLLSIGTGNVPPVPELHDEDIIQIPQYMFANKNIIKSIYGDNLQTLSVEQISKRIILAPTNAHTLQMNREIIGLLPGDPHIYYSADSVVSEDPNDALNYPTEFLHDQTPSGMPPHVLLLKKGVIIMLLRNLNPKKGMCNGTRLIARDLQTNLITAEIISECNRGDIVFIPRIDLAPSDTVLPFTLKRRQFPIIPAYAITINKSQGQTFDHVGIDLDTPVFSHGQLYVALSRCRNANNVKLNIHNIPQQGQLLGDDRQFTRNVVFKEIFTN